MPTPATSPVPPGSHSITAYLVVQNAARALEYYMKVFGATLVSQMKAPDGQSIMHAELRIGDSLVMLSDECPEMGARSPRHYRGTPVSLFLYVADVDAVYARAVEAGAEPIRPVADMFWGDRFGKIRDPFGHEWGLATHRLDLTPPEMEQAAAAWMSQNQ